MTVANGSRSSVIGKLLDVPVFFEKFHVIIDFVVLKNVLFGLVMRQPTLKWLGGILDFKSEEVRLDYKGKEATLPMVSEYSQSRFSVDGTDSEDFTSDFDDSESIPDEKDEGEVLVLTVCCDDLCEPNENVCLRASSQKKKASSK